MASTFSDLKLQDRSWDNYQHEDSAWAGRTAKPVLSLAGGVYRSSLPTYTDGDAAVLHFTSDGKLMVDTELEITGVTINNVKVFSTDNTAGNTKYAKVNSNAVPYTIVTNADATASAIPVAGNTVGVSDVALPVADANVKAAIAASSIALPTTIVGGTKNVTLAGTRVCIVLASTPSKSVSIRANAANTGFIYVGGVTVSSANGIALAANDQTEFNIANLDVVYIDSSLDGEGVGYTYFN